MMRPMAGDAGKGPAIEVPDSVRGLIFDCDGTLVDSMELHMEAWEQVLLRAGASFDLAFFLSKKGMKESEILDQYNEQFHAALDGPRIVAEKHAYFLGRVHTVKPLDAVVDVARRYSGRLPMAVASGSVRQIVTEELRVIGIGDLFATILTADDHLQQKPAPDMFVEAARRMKVPAHACQVFEDGDLGLLAARKAGMAAVDVRPLTGQ